MLATGDVSVTLTFSEPMNTGASGFSLYGSFTGTYYYASSSGFNDDRDGVHSHLQQPARGRLHVHGLGGLIPGHGGPVARRRGNRLADRSQPRQRRGGRGLHRELRDRRGTRALPTPLVDLPPAGAQVQQTPYARSGAIATRATPTTSRSRLAPARPPRWTPHPVMACGRPSR